MRRSTKAQMQLSETIFVVFIILVIMIFGFIFYSKTQEASIREQQREKHLRDIVALAHTITNWPELECSISEARDFACIDKVKLEALSSYIGANMNTNTYNFNYYRELLGKSKVIVKEVYPTSGVYNWTVYYNQKDGGSAETIFIPLDLLDPRTNTYSFGVMELTAYG